jgi:CRP-like cAMP-binding protein
MRPGVWQIHWQCTAARARNAHLAPTHHSRLRSAPPMAALLPSARPSPRMHATGEILIKQGDVGIAASELYVVKSGEFEILETRGGVNMRVNTKGTGDVFGEVSLMYNSPRNATVAATVKSTVCVLERSVFRAHVQETAETEGAQIELFLNSVPILQKLSVEERSRLAGALEELTFNKGARVVQQGDPGDLFYIIKEGEAVVYQDTPRGTRLVNRLFKSDFFGEQALLRREPRMASVEAVSTTLTCLALRRDVFSNILGDLHEIMNREKSPQVLRHVVSCDCASHLPGRPPRDKELQCHLFNLVLFSSVRHSNRNLVESSRNLMHKNFPYKSTWLTRSLIKSCFCIPSSSKPLQNSVLHVIMGRTHNNSSRRFCTVSV